MSKLSNVHPPVRGAKLAVSLALAKRREGVSQMDATNAGGGRRLAAQIFKLKERGHRFRQRGEGVERYARYWWIGFAPAAEDNSSPISEPPNNFKETSAIPPVPPVGRRAPNSSEGSDRHA